jgi:hypothetical protein
MAMPYPVEITGGRNFGEGQEARPAFIPIQDYVYPQTGVFDGMSTNQICKQLITDVKWNNRFT